MAGVIAIGAIPFLPVFASLVGCSPSATERSSAP